MNRLRSTLACFGRIALGLLLAIALLPSLSRAMAGADTAGPWAELCSSLRTSLPPPGARPDESAPSAVLQDGHCPLCSQPAALPAPAVAAVLLLQRATGHPPLFAQSPRPLHTWIAAAPRGPPVQA